MKYTLFGESHGSHIGIVLEDIPAGLHLDQEKIQNEMQRRSAKNFKSLSTQRQEADTVEIISGLYKNKTTGSSLCALIRNSDIISDNYDKNQNLPRPGHADYAAHMRYHGFNDFRGGGHFSGRLTAPLVFAGAIAKQFLNLKKVEIYARIKQLADISDISLDKACLDNNIKLSLQKLSHKNFPVIDDEKSKRMQKKILETKSEKDSLGGIIECFIFGLEAGLGSPGFDNNIETLIAKSVFAIPSVKGIEFGSGFLLASMKGSEANDALYIKDSKVYSKTNHNGGVTGGITNGMPLNFSVVIKPTPSIGKVQNTINLSKMTEEKIEIAGRHDPCIAPRALVVVEAAAALAISNLFEDKHV